MILSRHQGGHVILLSLLTSLLLDITPLPDNLQAFRPNWPALFLLYWCLALPQRIGVASAWFIGLLQDVLTGTLLGQHALTLSILAYITLRFHQRMRPFPPWQQALIVALLLLLIQLITLWINGIIGRSINSWSYWLPSLVGTLLWPLIFHSLRKIRRWFNVK